MPRFNKITTLDDLIKNINKYPIKKRNSNITETREILMKILKKDGYAESRYFRRRHCTYIECAFSEITNIEIAYASTIKATTYHQTMNYGTFSIRLVDQES